MLRVVGRVHRIRYLLESVDNTSKSTRRGGMRFSFLPCCSADDATRSEDESGPSIVDTSMKDTPVRLMPSLVVFRLSFSAPLYALTFRNRTALL